MLLLREFTAADIYGPPSALYDVVVGNLRTGFWPGDKNYRMSAYTDPTSSP